MSASRSAPAADLERQHDIGELEVKISSCISACGHHHVGHIGILGVDHNGEEDYQMTLGGRAFSYARLLRERHGFSGEIRAVGKVLRDQLAFMTRCGFDAFEAADERLLAAWREARREISVVYQPGADRRRAVMALRREEGHEAARGAASVAPSDAGRVRVCAGCWALSALGGLEGPRP